MSVISTSNVTDCSSMLTALDEVDITQQPNVRPEYAVKRKPNFQSALYVPGPRTQEVIAKDEPDKELQKDLALEGNVVFVGDVHLSGSFNDKRLKRFLETLDNWIQSGKKISRLVLMGDLINKFDPYEKGSNCKKTCKQLVLDLFEHDEDRDKFKFKVPEKVREGFCIVQERVQRAAIRIKELADLLTSHSIPIDYIWGNHEESLELEQTGFPALMSDYKKGLEALGINLLTQRSDELVSIGHEKDKLKASHRPSFGFKKNILKALMNKVKPSAHIPKSKASAELNPSFSGSDKVADGDIILAAHQHIPFVHANDKHAFVSAPSIVHNFNQEQYDPAWTDDELKLHEALRKPLLKLNPLVEELKSQAELNSKSKTAKKARKSAIKNLRQRIIKENRIIEQERKDALSKLKSSLGRAVMVARDGKAADAQIRKTFPPMFTVINPKASRKVHMVALDAENLDGRAVDFVNVQTT